MKRLYVYADFDWLKEIELIGELGYESLRGSDSYSFLFHDEWLRKLTHELLEGSEGLLQKLRESGILKDGAAPAGQSRGRASASGQQSQADISTDSEGRELRAFAFDDLDKVIAASKVIASFDTDSRLYKKDQEDSYYVLVLKCAQDQAEDSHFCLSHNSLPKHP